VNDTLPDVPYWPSSAHGGAFPHQANVGSTSYYGVGACLRAPEDARRESLNADADTGLNKLCRRICGS